MAEDDITNVDGGSGCEGGREQEVCMDAGPTDSCMELKPNDIDFKNFSLDQGKPNTLMFSRSAETFGNTGIDLKQTGQRPDRLHARRPSTGRRNGVPEHNPCGTRCACPKAAPRASRNSQIRASKSCTKECEIIRSDYDADYLDAAYSVLYEDLLKSDDSDTFTGLDAEDYEEDVTLSESTAVGMDNEELEVKEASVITQERISLSTDCRKAVQESTVHCGGSQKVAGANTLTLRKVASCSNSDEGLGPVDLTESRQRKSARVPETGNAPPGFSHEGQASCSWNVPHSGNTDTKDKVNTSSTEGEKYQMVCRGAENLPPGDLSKCSHFEAGMTRLGAGSQDPGAGNIKKCLLGHASTRDQLKLQLMEAASQEFDNKRVDNNDISKALLRFSTVPDSTFSSKTVAAGESAANETSTPCVSSVIKSDNTNEESTMTHVTSAREVNSELAELYLGATPPASSSGASVGPEMGGGFCMCRAEREQRARVSQNSKYSDEKRPPEKRAPYPEEITDAVAHALECGRFDNPCWGVTEAGSSEYLLPAARNYSLSFYDSNVDAFHKPSGSDEDQQFMQKWTEKVRPESPVISILSLNSTKEVPEMHMPSRRDHNDVYHGDKLYHTYSSSRSAASISSSTAANETVNGKRSDEVEENVEDCRQGENCGSFSQKSPTYPVTTRNKLIMPSICARESCSKRSPVSNMRAYVSVQDCARLPQEHVALSNRSEDVLFEKSTATETSNEAGDEGLHSDALQSQSFDLNPEPVSKVIVSNCVETKTLTLSGVENSRTEVTLPGTKSSWCGLARFSVPSLGTHEYLPFLNKLRSEKTPKKDSSQHQNSKAGKHLRKLAENGKKTAEMSEYASQGDDSLSSTPACSTGREVPTDYKPGELKPNLTTKLSNSLTLTRKPRKQKRCLRKKNRTQNRSQLRRKAHEPDSDVNKRTSQYAGKAGTQTGDPPEPSKSSSMIYPCDPGSVDADVEHEDETESCRYRTNTTSFEFKRRYYERMNKMKKASESAFVGSADHSPVPKRITSQVGLLKTLDEFYSSPSSDEGENEQLMNQQAAFDVNHQLSLFNYYSTRLKHLSVLEKVPTKEPVTRMPFIRIRKVLQEVPSALDHKRLKSLYECRAKKSILPTVKTRKVDSPDRVRARSDESPGAVVRAGKSAPPKKGWSRAAVKTLKTSRLVGSNICTPAISTLFDQTEQPNSAEAAAVVEKPLPSRTAHEMNSSKLRHTSYLDILKANNKATLSPGWKPGGLDADAVGSKWKPRSPGLESGTAKENQALPNLDQDSRTKAQTPKEKECNQKAKMKVRFADSSNEGEKERLVWELSDEDTWNSSVNAMLLRANRVMSDSLKNDHRYPKPDSARVVSPVPPKSPTFLKELLRQDTIERKQAKGQLKVEKKMKEAVAKPEKQEKPQQKAPTPPLSHLPSCQALQPPEPVTTAASTSQDKSCLLYTVSAQDGAKQQQQFKINEKSAGVLKISIQMSQRAQERAWLTHERLRLQRLAVPEYEPLVEMKSLPKKLAPLRISKPINFQNPDSRNLVRVPMKDILTKTRGGLRVSSQHFFQPKFGSQDQGQGSNFLLDQHSETLQYYNGPYMHQRNSSITPLYGDSNNNAFQNNGAEKNASQENKMEESSSAAETTPVHFNWDDLSFSRWDRMFFASNEVNESSAEDDGHSRRRCTVDANGNIKLDCQVELSSESDSKNLCAQVTSDKSLCETGSLLTGTATLTRDKGSISMCFADRTQDRLTGFLTNQFSGPEQIADEPMAARSLLGDSSQELRSAPSQNLRNISLRFRTPCSELGEIIRPEKADAPSCIPNTSAVSGGVFEWQDTCDENRSTSESTQQIFWEALLEYEPKEKPKSAPSNTSETIGRSSSNTFSLDERNRSLQECEGRAREAYRSAITGMYVSAACTDKWMSNFMETSQTIMDKSKQAESQASEQGGTETEIHKDDNSRESQADFEETEIHPEDTEIHQEGAVQKSASKVSQDSNIIDMSEYMQTLNLCRYPSTQDLLSRECQNSDMNQKNNEQFLRKPDPLIFDFINGADFGIQGKPVTLSNKHNTTLRTYARNFLPKPSYFVRANVSHTPWQKQNKTSNMSNKQQKSATLPPKNEDRKPTTRPRNSKLNSGASSARKCQKPKLQDNVSENILHTPQLTSASTTQDVSTEESSHMKLFEEVFKDFQEEYWCWNSQDDVYFNWERMKAPPPFLKGGKALSESSEAGSITWREVFRAASTRSACSSATVFPDEAVDRGANKLMSEEDSPRFDSLNAREDQTPHAMENFYFMRDPPNSSCSTFHKRDQMASETTKLSVIEHLSHDKHAIPSQDKLLASAKLLTTHTPRTHESEQLSLCSNTSEIREDTFIDSRNCDPTEKGTRWLEECNTASQVSDSFEEDDEGVVHDGEDTADGQKDVKHTVSRVPMTGAENREWHQLSENLKLRHVIRFARDLPSPAVNLPTSEADKPQVVSKNKPSSPRACGKFPDRSFLKSLRGTDLLHKVCLDRRRLLESLHLVTRHEGYLPVFQIKTFESLEMMPLVVTVNHCAPKYVEREISSVTERVRSLPVFYTEDSAGFLTSLYTVHWISEGMYTLEKTGDTESVEDAASSGRLLQYSPYAADLAFNSQRVYLIGDETTSREKALRSLITARDEAQGDIEKYFLMMCGWVPSKVSQFGPHSRQKNVQCLFVGDEEEDPASSSEDAMMSEVKIHVDEFPHLPTISGAVRCPCPARQTVQVIHDTEQFLPKIPKRKPFVLKSIKSPLSLAIVESIPRLPNIYKTAGMHGIGSHAPTVVLCLRCGMTVDAAGEDLEKCVPENPPDSGSFIKEETKPESNRKEERRKTNTRDSQNYPPTWEVSDLGVAFQLPTQISMKCATKENPRSVKRALKQSPATRYGQSLKRKTKSLTTFVAMKKNLNADQETGPSYVRSQHQFQETSFWSSSTANTSSVTWGMSEIARTPEPRGKEKTQAQEKPRITKSKDTRPLPTNAHVKKEVAVKPKAALTEGIVPKVSSAEAKCLSRKLIQRHKESQEKVVQSSAVTCQLSHTTLSPQPKAPKKEALQTTQSAPHLGKERSLAMESKVAGWGWNTELQEEEVDLMEKRTWSQPIIPPPFPANVPVNSAPSKGQKSTKSLQSSKAHLAQHRRNLTHISHSYVSPYWAKKEVKRARSKSPVSDSGDDRSSISRITTISGLSSSTSASSTEAESSTDESESDSASSATGSDFFTRYANKGGPTSVDDIFKRTLPRQRLNYSLNLIKEVKENEEREQLGYLRGREGETPPTAARSHGDNTKDKDREVTFVTSEFDMCSDAEEIKELWKLCFPEVDFWDRNRRKKFKKTKILS